LAVLVEIAEAALAGMENETGGRSMAARSQIPDLTLFAPA
jgi:hypothetical protein